MSNFTREFRQVPVTLGLSVLLGIIYVAEVIRSGGLDIAINTLYHFGGLVPAVVFGQNEWWRLLTAGFVHASLMHLLLNVVVIYFVGRMLETTLGSLQVGVIFLVGVLGGNLLTMLLGNIMVISIGASSGAFALVGAVIYLGWQERRRGVWGQQMQTMFIFVGMNLLFGLFDPSIGIWAHVGGFLFGVTVAGALLQSRYAKATFKTSPTKAMLAGVSTLVLLVILLLAVIMHMNNVMY